MVGRGNIFFDEKKSKVREKTPKEKKTSSDL